MLRILLSHSPHGSLGGSLISVPTHLTVRSILAHLLVETSCNLYYLCSGLAGTLSYSDPPSAPLWLDMSSDIGSLPVVGLPVEPLPVSKNSIVAMDISSVVALN
jgi:hypothetical protein